MKKLTLLTTSMLFFAITSSFLTACSCKHEWEEATCTESKTCTLCNETEGEPLGHEFAAATCTLPETCSICNETNGESLGHSTIIDQAVEPTCTTEGLTEGQHCDVCDEILIPQEEIKPLGHTKGEWTMTKEATLTNVGVEEILCTKCGESLDSKGTERKKPKVIGSSFNFTDDEFIDWMEDNSTIEIGSKQSLNSDMNTAYLITNSDGVTGVLALNHGSNGLQGNVCGIMIYFDSSTYASALGIWIGEKINSDFIKEDAAEKLLNNKSYTKASMTIMRLDIGGVYATTLAPSEFYDELLS